ncbi:hypothetical protein BC833DRAFT_573176 [Globomyces pollinis-pini]|nr:hypothetical protein BC833DRAFT_573176 [Globomyces pollinis-pini]
MDSSSRSKLVESIKNLISAIDYRLSSTSTSHTNSGLQSFRENVLFMLKMEKESLNKTISELVSLRKEKLEKLFVSKEPEILSQGLIISDSDGDIPLSIEEKLLLEAENNSLIEQLEGTLNLVRNATQSINEVSQMQNTLNLHLAAQTELVDSLHSEAKESTLSIEKGNEHLQKADEIFGGPKFWVLILFVLLSILLLIIDYALS